MEFTSPKPETPPAGGSELPSIEREIAELERQLAEKREAAGRVTPVEAQPQAAPPQSAPATPIVSPPSVMPASLAQQPRVQQVKMLTDIALEQGIREAVDIARKIGSAYLLDELHDALQDELYKALKDSE